MSKTISIKMAQPSRQAADNWINKGVESHLKPVATDEAAHPAIETKRLTIDIPVELHTRIKSACAQRNKVMADEVRRLLDAEFPNAVES